MSSRAKETNFYFALNQLGTSINLTDNWKYELCAGAICDAEDLCNEWGVRVSRRIKKTCSTPGENASDAGLYTQEEMHLSLREILDKTVVEISDHFS
jgi:hypothetical protein